VALVGTRDSTSAGVNCYEVAVIQLMVDEIGLGSGSIAAGARVRPGGETGVQIDDYADESIKLVTVSRKIV
jgi:hypothetical protein